MAARNLRKLPDSEARRLGPASMHYLSYVGPPAQYDLLGASQFNLLCALGLRGHHRVLDFGCGSLRAGRLLIPFLEPGCYFAIEPNTWLIDDAIDRQLGRDILAIKQPRFSAAADFNADQFGEKFEFILAQSIFSHAGPRLARTALGSFSRVLLPQGLCVATFMPGDEDTPEGWHYGGQTPRGIVRYRTALIESLLREAGLQGARIPWYHPRQDWWLFGFKLPPARYRAMLLGVVLRCKDFAGSVPRAKRPPASFSV